MGMAANHRESAIRIADALRVCEMVAQRWLESVELRVDATVGGYWNSGKVTLSDLSDADRLRLLAPLTALAAVIHEISCERLVAEARELLSEVTLDGGDA